MNPARHYFVIFGIVVWLFGCYDRGLPPTTESGLREDSSVNSEISPGGGRDEAGDGITGESDEGGDDSGDEGDLSSPEATITGNPRPNGGGNKPMGLIFRPFRPSDTDSEAPEATDAEVISASTVVQNVEAAPTPDEREVLVPEESLIVDLVSGSLLGDQDPPPELIFAPTTENSSVLHAPSLRREEEVTCRNRLVTPTDRTLLRRPKGEKAQDPSDEKTAVEGDLVVTFGSLSAEDSLFETAWGRLFRGHSQILHIQGSTKGKDVIFLVDRTWSVAVDYPESLEGAENLIVSFDTDLWLQGINLDFPGFSRCQGAGEAALVIAGKDYPEVIKQLIANQQRSARIFAD